jgi:hypothetical protein
MDTSDPRQMTIWLARAVVYVAYAYLVINELILVQGFLLELFGANPGSSYVDWAYRSLERVMAPFRGMFEPIQLDGRSVLDTSIIFAAFIYGVLVVAVSSLIDWLTYRLARVERDRAAEEARERAEATAAGGIGQETTAARSTTPPPSS